MADRSGYIGRAPGDSSVIIARQTFEPTGIQTDFTFASGYTPGYIDVYLNGSRLIVASDYTATDGSVVGLTTNATNGDVLECVAYKAFNLANPISNTSGGSLSVGSDLTVNGITQSSSKDTGAIICEGGVGIEKNLFVGGGAEVTGITTLSTLKVGTAATINSSGLDVVGIASVGTAITMYGSSGIVSATSFYGDGSNLSNIISGVGVNSGGTNIGYGVTTLNFVGSGTTIEVSGTTANISAGGGSGVSTTGILTARGFANADDITESITLDDYYGTGTNYGMVGPITVTGAGTTITVGVGVSYVII